MRIFLASYQSIMLNKGGPTYKILHLKKALEKLGINVQLFDMWDENNDFKKDDLVHIFNASIATYSFSKNLVSHGARYVVNPIFYSNHTAKVLRSYQILDKAYRKVFKRSYSDYSITKDICISAEKVLPNTKAEADLLILGLNINKDRVQVIHNGVEKRFAEADATLFQKKYGLKDFVLYVGHLGPVRKNGKNIIKTLQQIDHPAVIIADILHNEEGEWCRSAINESNNITLIEWINHNDPLFASAYAACNTFILPTKYETPGRAALEAGIAGANIVITPYGGTKEYFGKFAEYPNPHSVESIKKAIEISLNKKKNDKLQNHFQKNYIWDIIAERTLEVYKEIFS